MLCIANFLSWILGGTPVIPVYQVLVCDVCFESCFSLAVFRKAALLFGWLVFLLLAYKVSKLDREYQEYNPYEVLSLDPVKTHTHTHTR